MAERDKVIKSGQITLPRILFLVLFGALMWVMVSVGGKALIIGYWGLTLVICGLLYLIAIDYRVKMDRVEIAGSLGQSAAAPESESTPTATVKTTMGERPKRKSSRPARRRR